MYGLIQLYMKVINNVIKFGFPPGEGRKRRKTFLTRGWEYGLECVGGFRSCEKFKVHFAFAS